MQKLVSRNVIEDKDMPDLTPLGDVLVEPDANTSPYESKRSFISAGERIHKWGTYLSVDWIFNAATGVGFAYWGSYTDMGKKMWSGPITNFFTKALKPFIKDPKQLKSSAGYGNMFMSVIAGGMFTIPPLMALEDNDTRKSITKFFDQLIYGKEKVASDPKFQQAYDEIEHTPKKDFASGLTSRFAALAPLLALVLIPATKKFSNKIWFNHVENASDAVARSVGFSEKSFKNIPVREAKERWKFIHESVAMDFGLGIPYAILHAFFYNMFSKKKAKTEAENQQTDAPIFVQDEQEKNWVEATRPQEKHTGFKETKENFVARIAENNAMEVQRA